MSARALSLGVLGVIAIAAAVLIVRGDLAHDERPRRRWVEAMIPLLGVVALVWWAWVSL